MVVQKHYLGTLSFTILIIATVMSLKGFPLIAATGFKMVFYLLFSAFFFLIPGSLVSAELSSCFNKPGGVYLWVKAALGPRFGVVSVWIQWVQNIIWAPTIIGFAADSFSYTLGLESLAKNGIYTASMIIVVYWFAVFITLKGLKLSTTITTIGAIIGIFTPALFVIGLGVIWVLSGKTINISFSLDNIFPDFNNFNSISFIAGIVILFSGMEVNAVHINSLRKPTTDYVRSIIFASIFMLGIFFLGSLSLAMIIPSKSISLTTGVMQSIQKVLVQYDMVWVVKIFGALITFGVLASVIAWICGPSKGLLIAAEHKELPKILSYKNKNGIQRNILILQACLVMLFASLQIVIDNVNEIYFLLTEMGAILYLIMYILMFVSAIVLRYKMPDTKREFKIPGGNIGMWIVSGIGILSAIFSMTFAFFPPGNLHVSSTNVYMGIIASGVLIFTIIPVIIFRKQVKNK
jgi:amino acid transporter